MVTKRVKLKEHSPEFADDKKQANPKACPCDMPGCQNLGEHKAPKNRGLSEYYVFCMQHAREYNAAWDFFEGMSEADIQAHMRDSMFGDRPTWIYTAAPDWEETLRAKAGTYRDYDDNPHAGERARTRNPAPPPDVTPERDALAIMSLEPPVTFPKIKERYRTLMKQYHPDRNQGDKNAEEIVKRINMAYTILKAAHEKYEKLEK